MKIILVFLLFFTFATDFSYAQEEREPEIWVSLNPSPDEQYWLVYREETDSELYPAANDTILPLVMLKLNKEYKFFWGLAAAARKNQQVEFDICFRSQGLESLRWTHNFFSEGNDKKLSPTVSCVEGCFKIEIPEEHGQTRKVIIQRGLDLNSFKKTYKVSPLMPFFHGIK